MSRRHAVAAVACTCLLVSATATATATAVRAPHGVRLRVVRLVDRSRLAHFSDGTSTARILTTEVRYPSRGAGPFPLVVFAHGFALLPDTYRRLLDAWARAGYVVAAPIFPVENANARGGPSRSDLVNEPRDLSFVLSRLIAPGSPVRRLVDPRHVAFAGQSDGAVAAFAASYQGGQRDRRVGAAVIMSGAPLGTFTRPPSGTPPLLAVQGTADPFNAPATTAAYFQVMPRPKYLLWLLGASHRPPYTTDLRYLDVVERVTIAFLDHYLRGEPIRPLVAGATRPGLARLVANP